MLVQRFVVCCVYWIIYSLFRKKNVNLKRFTTWNFLIWPPKFHTGFDEYQGFFFLAFCSDMTQPNLMLLLHHSLLSHLCVSCIDLIRDRVKVVSFEMTIVQFDRGICSIRFKWPQLSKKMKTDLYSFFIFFFCILSKPGKAFKVLFNDLKTPEFSLIVIRLWSKMIFLNYR